MFSGPVPGVAGAMMREVAHLPESLSGAVRVGPYSVARRGAVLRCVPGVARFLAHGGNRIDVMSHDGADPGTIESLILGPLAAALIHQRGELPLHCATLIPYDTSSAVAIVGRQGAGKSTLAYELVIRGWQLLSDDLTRVTRASDQVLAWPGRFGIKLCRDACERVGLPAARMTRVSGERGKFLAPVAPHDAPVPLRLVIVIERGGDAGGDVGAAAAMSLISAHTFRLSYVAALGQCRHHIGMAAAVVSAVRVIRLGGPRSLHDLAETVCESAAQYAAE